MDGKVGNHAFGNKKLPAVVTDKVCILRQHMGREHDFLVGDFGFIGIVFLLLVVFREQLLAVLVGGRIFSF